MQSVFVHACTESTTRPDLGRQSEKQIDDGARNFVKELHQVVDLVINNLMELKRTIISRQKSHQKKVMRIQRKYRRRRNNTMVVEHIRRIDIPKVVIGPKRPNLQKKDEDRGGVH